MISTPTCWNLFSQNSVATSFYVPALRTFNNATSYLFFQQPDPRPSKKFTTLKDVKDESSIEDLTIRQLKEILTANFVDYKGCCEKRELIDRVRRLYQDSQKNQQKGQCNKIFTDSQLKRCTHISLKTPFFFYFCFLSFFLFFSVSGTLIL